VIGLHILGLAIVAILAYRWYGYHTLSEFLKHISEYLHYVAFISGLFLFVLSLKGEVLVSQTYEFASSTAQASSHQFDDFKSHLEWINEFISPAKFESHSTNLTLSISTPIYGIGVSKENASLFLDYFESWVENYERIKAIPNERPTIELSVWDKSENVKTFTENYTEEQNQEKHDLIVRYSALLKRMTDLRRNGFVNFHLYFTDKSDARLFMAHTPGTQKYSGLFVIFTPLNPTAVTRDGWTLTGFSFSEEKGYQNSLNFNFRMTHRDNEVERIDRVNTIKDWSEWLLDHYGLQKSNLAKTES
jgi:hypothetical protein